MTKPLFALLLLLTCAQRAGAQHPAPATGDAYVDARGVLRWKNTKREVALFGVNYTAPFAYAYRADKALGVAPEKAIDQDVYHLARLGVDAFRVHVWDVEISDSVGNVLENEHLRLLDYLVAQLRQRGIRIILTPIAYWGNGYPEADTKTPGFSTIYGKGQAYTNPRAVRAQENYLRQFLNHRNQYTKLLNKEDPDIIAFEVCNEPRYHKPEVEITAFANRMVQAIRATDCRKPVFYNVSENPPVYQAILNANVDGLTFQWYPQGLVSGHALRGNFLPYVDQYPIPFQQDKRFRSKARMIYEFESADILQPIMYPFMARSFRAAGFQWATQFAYDPLTTAYANPEYQTHYLNLAYTPAKALSLLIAGKVFRRVGRGQAFPHYPADSVFDAFRVSYRQGLSEMNAPEEFYYTGSTQTRPVQAAKLQHLAGVGSSPVVQYGGTGAYFLDKLAPGVWRLEVMPDAVLVQDPFGTPSLRKTVSQISWADQPLQLILPDIGTDFRVSGLNEGNTFQSQATDGRLTVRPGAYLVAGKARSIAKWTAQTTVGTIRLGEFVAPPPAAAPPMVVHEAYAQVAAGQPVPITAQVTGAAAADSLLLVVQRFYGSTISLPMRRTGLYEAAAVVPASQVTPGLLRYWIVLKKGAQAYTFPGGFPGQPRDWDYYHPERWETAVVAPTAPLLLYDARQDLSKTELGTSYPAGRADYVATKQGQLALRLTLTPSPEATEQVAALRRYIAPQLRGRFSDVPAFQELVVKAQATAAVRIKVYLVTKDAVAYSAEVSVPGGGEAPLHIPLTAFRPDVLLLVPRPYPGFLPLTFQAGRAGTFRLADMEVLQVALEPGAAAADVAIESVQVR